MKHRTCALLAALASALALAAAVGQADASTLVVVERAYTGTWSSVSFQALEGVVRCPLTLEGTFTTATYAKTAGARMGSIGRASLAACTGGSVRVSGETLPWTTQYASFSGTLPKINGDDDTSDRCQHSR